MTFTIEAGWWLIPAAITLICFAWAIAAFSEDRGDYSFAGVFNLLMLLAAAVPSLIAWLVWALAA